jgi:capsular exopolysaccharide synthesis family protein
MAADNVNQGHGMRGGGLSVPREADTADLDLWGMEAAPAEKPDGLGGSRFQPLMLLRYKWSILALFLLVAGAATPVIWLMFPPVYQAVGHVQVSPTLPDIWEGQEAVPFYEHFRRSQAQVILSPEVLGRVLDEEAVRQTAWYRGESGSLLTRLRAPAPPEDRLAATLEVDVPRSEQFLQVSLSTEQPGEAGLIVREVLNAYKQVSMEEQGERNREIVDEIEAQLERRTASLETLETSLNELRRQMNTSSPEALVDQQMLRLDRLQSELQALETELAWSNRMLDSLGGAEPSEEADAGTDTVAFENDRRWQELNRELEQARNAFEMTASRLGPKHPQYKQRERMVQMAEQRLADREALLKDGGGLMANPLTLEESEDNPYGVSAAQVRVRIEQIQLRADALRGLFNEQEQEFLRNAARAQTHREMEAQLEKDKELRERLEKRREELLAQRNLRAGTVLIRGVREPSAPSNDRRIKMIGAAIFGGLAFSLGVAFLRIKFSPTVDDVGGVAEPMNGAFLGRLPLRRDQSSLAVELCPILAESVRMVRTSLLNRLPRETGACVQIASAGPGSGKSTFSTLLGRSLAQCGKRVLLVDVDIRRPALAARFGIDPAPGLFEVLADSDAEQNAIRATGVPKLFVLPTGGTASIEQAESLANGALGTAVKRWREQYDIILLDGAPLLVTADAAILSRVADGTIFVVRERHCRRQSLMESLALLSAAGGRLLGTVFVGSGQDRRYGYGYGYGYGYAYQSGSEAAPMRALPDSEKA